VPTRDNIWGKILAMPGLQQATTMLAMVLTIYDEAYDGNNQADGAGDKGNGRGSGTGTGHSINNRCPKMRGICGNIWTTGDLRVHVLRLNDAGGTQEML
jgi:hypothetical protein